MKKINFLLEQKKEITNSKLYSYLSKKFKGKNSLFFKEMALEEMDNYNFWKKLSKKEVKPNPFILFFYFILFNLFGLIFSIKIMSLKEKKNQEKNKSLVKKIPSLSLIIHQKNKREQKLFLLIDEKKINLINAVILGMNNSLIEITGTLAGLTLAIPKTNLIGLSGLIVGITASLSLASSGYLVVKEDNFKSLVKPSIYTGLTYVILTLILVSPFFIFTNAYLSLLITFVFVTFILGIYTFYSSIVKEVSFKRQFMDILAIYLTVTLITFAIAFLIKGIFGLVI